MNSLIKKLDEEEMLVEEEEEDYLVEGLGNEEEERMRHLSQNKLESKEDAPTYKFIDASKLEEAIQKTKETLGIL